MIPALIAAGCLADDPLGMTYEIGACDLQKASDALPSVLAAYEPSDAEATHDDSMNMTDDAMAMDDEAVVGPLDLQDQAEVEMAEMADMDLRRLPRSGPLGRRDADAVSCGLNQTVARPIERRTNLAVVMP